MKKFFTSMLAGLTGSPATPPAPNVQSMPVKSILFSMPTIANDAIDYIMPDQHSFAGAPQFHEDDWTQLEFFSKDRLRECQDMLIALKAFEAENRVESGWLNIYVRDIARTAVVGSVQSLTHDLSAPRGPSPILTTSSAALGQVRDGFTIKLSENSYVYGLEKEGEVSILGVSLQETDNQVIQNTFSLLDKKYGLILVDWQQQFILVSVGTDGYFEIWRP